MSVIRISRPNLLRRAAQHHRNNVFVNYSDDRKDSPVDGGTEIDSKVGAEKKDDKEKVSTRLNQLLAMMSTDSNSNLNIVKSVVKPKSSNEKLEKRLKSGRHAEDPKPDNVTEAIKQVASDLGGNTNKTESELLAKLLETRDHGTDNLKSLIGNMKVESEPSRTTERRSDFVRKSVEKNPFFRKSNEPVRDGFRKVPRDEIDIQRSKIKGVVDLFGGPRLGVFEDVTDLKDSSDTLSTWNKLQQRELKLAVTHPPANYFQKMALWTEQGKLWKFPIDNEQGMDEEAKVYFTEHVFLDKHIASWCPTKGPIRHFMDLVCVGLSKNPYYTVTQKKDHLDWFRDYFAEKKELLDSVIIHEAAPPKELEK